MSQSGKYNFTVVYSGLLFNCSKDTYYASFRQNMFRCYRSDI